MLSAANWQAELQPEQCRPAGRGAEQGEPQGAQYHQSAGQAEGSHTRLHFCRSPSFQPPSHNCQVSGSRQTSTLAHTPMIWHCHRLHALQRRHPETVMSCGSCSHLQLVAQHLKMTVSQTAIKAPKPLGVCCMVVVHIRQGQLA